MGVINLDQAIALARTKELDLILVAPEASPAVCKIADYGKYRYEVNKKEKESRKGSHRAGIVKELKMTPKISEHDYQVRVKHAKTFLEKGYKVSVGVFFKGRELQHPDIGLRHLMRFSQEVIDYGVVERKPILEGKMMVMLLVPISGGKRKIAQNKNEKVDH